MEELHMEQQKTGMFMTKQDQEQFDSWSKEQIYEAYLLEHKARVKLNKENIKLSQRLFNQSEAMKKHAADILAWAKLSPKVYYKDGKAYGLTGTVEGEDGILYVASMVEDVDAVYTIAMLKDIIRLYNARKICLITDVESKQELIHRTLNRYDFTYSYKDGIMYSTGGKIWE